MIIMEVINNNNSIISDSNEYNTSETNGMKDSNGTTNVVSEQESITNVVPKEEDKNTGNLSLEQPVEDTKPKLPLLLVPSLKGKMSYEGGDVTCKGVWGMSDEAHNQPGQTSEFEFKLLKKDDDSQMFPVDGLYQGWFMMKQPPPLKPVKVDEKELIFKFTSMENGSYSIDGKGVNKFGSFNLRGTLSEDGNVHVYREYFSINPPGSAKRRMSHTPRATPRAGSEKKKSGKEANSNQDQLISPREGAGRVRKQSIAMQEYQDTVALKSPRVSTGSDNRGKEAKQFTSLKRQESGSSTGMERAQRLSYPIKKCLEVVKELSRIPQAQWFLEPVDYVKLNLPEYPNIVKKPMDFSTIRSKANAGDYETPESFADDMRLVFRNAITYNTASDNPVHIAAREMAVRFEERYRVLTSQLDGNGVYSAASAAMLDEASGKSNKLRKSLSKGQLKGMSSSASSSNLSKKSKKSLGPRPSAPLNYHMLPTSDASAYQIAQMQRQMARMQQDIDELRLLVRQNQVVDRVIETREAAQNPLSLQEKQLLISQIHKLVDTELMGPVLEIIQSALPHEANIDEIPLDVLDTLTLRKLQQYVEEVLPIKKRRTSNGGNGSKRQRKSGSTASYSEPMPVDGNSAFEQGHFGDEELLFPNESFDHPSQSSNPPNSNSNPNQTSGGRPRAGSLDDEDFSALAGMKQSSPATYTTGTVPDPSATTAIPEWYKP